MISVKKYLVHFLIGILSVSVVFPNVILSLGDVDVQGYTNEIIVPVTLENPNNTVGGFQFDLEINDENLLVSGVSAIDSENFSADYNILNNGDIRVVFFTLSGDGIVEGDASVVVNLHFNGSDILSGFFNLNAFDLTVSDEDGTIVNSQINDGSITIGTFISMSATSDTGDINEEVVIDINLENSGLVGGLQFDIVDTPNYLSVIGLNTTNRSEGFTIDFNELSNGLTRVLMFSSENQNIETGSGPIASLQMLISENAYNSNVGVNFENVTITDPIGGVYVTENVDSGTVAVTPGYIEEPHNLQAQDGMDAQVLLSWDALMDLYLQILKKILKKV